MVAVLGYAAGDFVENLSQSATASSTNFFRQKVH